MSNRGAESGRTTVAGWRSKVTTTDANHRISARSRSRLMRALCPRWTPSYAPMVTAVPPGTIGNEAGSAMTSIVRRLASGRDNHGGLG